MNFYFTLFSILLTTVLFHFYLIYKSYLPFAISYIEGNDANDENALWDKKKDRYRTLQTFFLFSAPLFGFKLLKIINSDNIYFNGIFLIAIIAFSILSLYCHKYRVWINTHTSKSNNNKTNKAFESETIIEAFKTELNKKIKTIDIKVETITQIDEKIDILAGNIQDLDNKLSNSHNKVKEIITEERKEFNCKTKSIDNRISNLKIDLDKLKNKVFKKEITIEFKLFFKNNNEFNRTIHLLYSNGYFSETKKPTVTELTILVCKLDELKTIKYYRKQKYLCVALANYFGIETFDKSNLTNSLKNYRNVSFSDAHKEIFNNLNYLKELNS